MHDKLMKYYVKLLKQNKLHAYTHQHMDPLAAAGTLSAAHWALGRGRGGVAVERRSSSHLQKYHRVHQHRRNDPSMEGQNVLQGHLSPQHRTHILFALADYLNFLLRCTLLHSQLYTTANKGWKWSFTFEVKWKITKSLLYEYAMLWTQYIDLLWN